MTERLPGLFEGTQMPTAGWWEALWPNPAAVLQTIGLKRGDDVIDLCSGDGWFTFQIARVARHVVAIDLDADLLGVARQRLGEAGIANCSYVIGDAYAALAQVSQRVDLVFLANTFHGFPDHLRLALGVREALKPSGRFAIVNWHQRRREETPILGEPRGPRTELRLSPAQTIAAVEPAGLRLLRVVELPPYHYGVVLERSAA